MCERKLYVNKFIICMGSSIVTVEPFVSSLFDTVGS